MRRDGAGLDRPVWHSLSTRHASMSEGGDRALRMRSEFGLFAAAIDDEPESLAALAALVPKDGAILLLQVGSSPVPPGLMMQMSFPSVQMVGRNVEHLAPGEGVMKLTCDDAAEMLALATLTQPGPFFARTNELGQFWGIKHGGRLVAMAGERLAFEGYGEVSGVCTHPDCRGRGYAGLLSRVVATQILKRGETPFLHAIATNTTAIGLYEALGFVMRVEVSASVLVRG